MLEAPECPVRTCEWIQRSTDPRSNDMKILRGRGRGGQRIAKYRRESLMVASFLMLGIQVRRGWWRRKFVSGGALGQVRRVKDVMCSEQVQQDGVGGDRAQGWMCRVPHC